MILIFAVYRFFSILFFAPLAKAGEAWYIMTERNKAVIY